MTLGERWPRAGRLAVVGAALLAGLWWLTAGRAVLPSNAAGLATVRGLLAGAPVDEATLEQARQDLYLALDHGLPPAVFAERMGNLEVARWQRLGDAAPDGPAHTYADWTRLHFDRLLRQPALLEHGDWLPAAQAAEQLELWSLAGYLYGRAEASGASSAATCLGHGRALLELRQAAAALPSLTCALDADPASPAAQWRWVQALAQLARWPEAAAGLQRLAQEAPAVVNTSEAAALAAEVAQHVPLEAPAAVQSAWDHQAANLVANGSFEAGIAGWAMAPVAGVWTLPVAGPAAGMQAMQVTFAGTDDVNYYQVFQMVPVEPNTRYTLAAQVKTEALTGLLALEVRSGDWMGGNAVQGAPTTAGWVPITLEFETPATVSAVAITLRRYGGNGLVAGSVWLDDIGLWPTPAPAGLRHPAVQ